MSPSRRINEGLGKASRMSERAPQSKLSLTGRTAGLWPAGPPRGRHTAGPRSRPWLYHRLACTQGRDGAGCSAGCAGGPPRGGFRRAAVAASTHTLRSFRRLRVVRNWMFNLGNGQGNSVREMVDWVVRIRAARHIVDPAVFVSDTTKRAEAWGGGPKSQLSVRSFAQPGRGARRRRTAPQRWPDEIA